MTGRTNACLGASGEIAFNTTLQEYSSLQADTPYTFTTTKGNIYVFLFCYAIQDSRTLTFSNDVEIIRQKIHNWNGSASIDSYVLKAKSNSFTAQTNANTYNPRFQLN